MEEMNGGDKWKELRVQNEVENEVYVMCMYVMYKIALERENQQERNGGGGDSCQSL